MCLIRPIDTLLRLDRPLWQARDINEWLFRHGITPTASIVNMMISAGGLLLPVKTAFAYTGADQAYSVPWGITRVRGKLWAGGTAPYSTTVPGAAAGFAAGVLAVTPGEILTIIVAQAGQKGDPAALGRPYGGGGNGNSYGRLSGAGRSAIRRGGTELSTAGGAGAPNYTGSGGNGGGLNGNAGTGWGTMWGRGGTQTAGGAGGDPAGLNLGTENGQAGTQFQGGDAAPNGGVGGGGGWWGGGGSAHGAILGDTTKYGGAGGGSSYTGGMTEASTQAGSGTVPGGSTDPDYVAGVGIGATTGVTGGNGRVVIETIP